MRTVGGYIREEFEFALHHAKPALQISVLLNILRNTVSYLNTGSYSCLSCFAGILYLKQLSETQFSRSFSNTYLPSVYIQSLYTDIGQYKKQPCPMPLHHTFYLLSCRFQ